MFTAVALGGVLRATRGPYLRQETRKRSHETILFVHPCSPAAARRRPHSWFVVNSPAPASTDAACKPERLKAEIPNLEAHLGGGHVLRSLTQAHELE